MKPFVYRLLICALLIVGSFAWAADGQKELIVNGNFAAGLASWKATGDVIVQNATAPGGSAAVRLGPGAASIEQKVSADPANHCTVKVMLQSEPAGTGELVLHFLDKNGRELMVIDSDRDIKHGKEPRKIAEYFRPNPLTATIVLEIKKSRADATVLVGPVSLVNYTENDPSIPYAGDLDAMMQPIWSGETVRSEAILMLSTDGEPAMGTLMFQPTRILSVTDYESTTTYKPGVDYIVKGRTLICAPNSSMPKMLDSELKKGDLSWNRVGGRQILVTYEHEDKWTGPTQSYVGAELPRTMQILREHKPLRIVAYGDSITFGVGSGRMNKIYPFQPPWIEMFAKTLEKAFADSAITLLNASQSGADSEWADRMATRMVGTLKPDLVVVAFGQNDFWRISPEEFDKNIRGVIEQVRAVDPGVEFLLVSTMRFDPSYSSKSAYWNLVTQYDEELRKIQGPGVQLVDFTSISGAIFAAKEPKDCLNDPLHPNDYLARWYAQSLVAALKPDTDRE